MTNPLQPDSIAELIAECRDRIDGAEESRGHDAFLSRLIEGMTAAQSQCCKCPQRALISVKEWQDKCKQYERTEAARLGLIDELARLQRGIEVAEIAVTQKLAHLRSALQTIAGGMTTEFPGAPDVMAMTSPAEFRGEMWVWSQKCARAALEAKP